MRRVVVGGERVTTLLSETSISNVRTWSDGIVLKDVWSTNPDASTLDASRSPTELLTSIRAGETRWLLVEFPPQPQTARDKNPVMHRTQSVDYFILLAGELEMWLEDGSITTLRAGDCVVQLSGTHGWRNVGQDRCIASVVMIGTGEEGPTST